MTMKPSEYFDRNCFIGASNTRRRELINRYEIGVGNLMWGNDFPHPEGTWPHTKEFFARNFFDIPRDETARILGLNAAEVYNFDADHRHWDLRREAGRHWLTGREVTG